MKSQDYLKDKINQLTKQNAFLIKESQHYRQELEQLKSKLDKIPPKTPKPKPVRFCLNDKIIKLAKRCIAQLIQIDPIAG